MKKLDYMIVDLLEMNLTESNGRVVFTDEVKELIHSIAKRCNEIPIVQQTGEWAREYTEGLSPEEIYTDMLYKIVEAPTRLHMKVAVRMLIPVIDKKLWGGKFE